MRASRSHRRSPSPEPQVLEVGGAGIGGAHEHEHAGAGRARLRDQRRERVAAEQRVGGHGVRAQAGQLAEGRGVEPSSAWA